MIANVRFWHKADITIVLNHVRFWGNSGYALNYGENLQPGDKRCNVRSGHDCKRWYLGPMIDYLVD
jgi:hypothetical protein